MRQLPLCSTITSNPPSRLGSAFCCNESDQEDQPFAMKQCSMRNPTPKANPKGTPGCNHAKTRNYALSLIEFNIRRSLAPHSQSPLHKIGSHSGRASSPGAQDDAMDTTLGISRVGEPC